MNDAAPSLPHTPGAMPNVCGYCGHWYATDDETCAAAAPLPPGNWQHSGPCVYCSHGPSCVRCETTGGPDAPVCSTCAEEITRAEIAADPYYRGDTYAMFGDDE